jgi:hypothetical protein
VNLPANPEAEVVSAKSLSRHEREGDMPAEEMGAIKALRRILGLQTKGGRKMSAANLEQMKGFHKAMDDHAERGMANCKAVIGAVKAMLGESKTFKEDTTENFRKALKNFEGGQQQPHDEDSDGNVAEDDDEKEDTEDEDEKEEEEDDEEENGKRRKRKQEDDEEEDEDKAEDEDEEEEDGKRRRKAAARKRGKEDDEREDDEAKAMDAYRLQIMREQMMRKYPARPGSVSERLQLRSDS